MSQTLVELDDEGSEQRAEGRANNPAVRFLLERVVPWLADKERTDTEHLVEMVFSSLSCCSLQETTRILDHITAVTSIHPAIFLKLYTT